MNYFTSVFNLLNVAIGSGIIGLGSVAASMGYIPYIAFNILVVSISIFTLNLVCQSATRVYKWRSENRSNQVADSNRNDSIISEEEKKDLMGYDIRDTYKIAYSYEDIANILFGKWALIANNLCILFYLFSCQMSYMTLVKDTLPSIILDFGRISNPDFSIEDKWYFHGQWCLMWVLLLILFPLGCAKRIDFLGFTSAIGMFAMTTFVFTIIAKQPDISGQCGSGNISYPLANHSGFNHDIETECEMKPINLSTDSIYAAGICLFAYMSHCNVLAIFAEVRTKSLERMRGVVYGAILPCTGLYILSAMYAYASFYNHTQAQLIELYSFIKSDGGLILMSNCLVMTCIIFSIPLAQYPARNTIWKLIYTIAPNRFPEPFLPSELRIPVEKRRAFPHFPFYGIMLVSYFFVYYVVVSAANFKLFLALSGAVSGSTVIMIFPALFHLKMEKWKCNTIENVCSYGLLVIGFITLIGNSSLIIYDEFIKA